MWPSHTDMQGSVAMCGLHSHLASLLLSVMLISKLPSCSHPGRRSCSYSFSLQGNQVEGSSYCWRLFSTYLPICGSANQELLLRPMWNHYISLCNSLMALKLKFTIHSYLSATTHPLLTLLNNNFGILNDNFDIKLLFIGCTLSIIIKL